MLSSLQWLAIGAVAGGISISAGPFSTAYLSGLIWAYAASRGRSASDDPKVRRWWSWAAALSLLAAACSFAGWWNDAVGIVGWWLGVAVILVLIWSLRFATLERDMAVAPAWRRLAVAAVPAAALAGTAMVVVLARGELRDAGAGGSYVRLRSADLSVSGNLQWAVLVMLVPLLATFVWCTVLFVRTYRTANAAARHWERVQRAEQPRGTV